MKMYPCCRIGVVLSMYHREGKKRNNKKKNKKQTNSNEKQKEVSRFIPWILNKQGKTSVKVLFVIQLQ